jgi:hypothetical protein
MIRLALVLLALTGTAMARDGNIQKPKAPNPAVSEQDQYLDKLYGDYEAGRIDFNTAYDLYTQKYGEPDYSKEPAEMTPYIPPLGKTR